MKDVLMSAADVRELVGCGRSTLEKWVAEGKFPKAVRVNGLRRWWRSTILDFITNPDDPNPSPESPPQRKPKKKKRVLKRLQTRPAAGDDGTMQLQREEQSPRIIYKSRMGQMRK